MAVPGRRCGGPSVSARRGPRCRWHGGAGRAEEAFGAGARSGRPAVVGAPAAEPVPVGGPRSGRPCPGALGHRRGSRPCTRRAAPGVEEAPGALIPLRSGVCPGSPGESQGTMGRKVQKQSQVGHSALPPLCLSFPVHGVRGVCCAKGLFAFRSPGVSVFSHAGAPRHARCGSGAEVAGPAPYAGPILLQKVTIGYSQ